MFYFLKRYYQDARALSKLCTAAEDLARAHGRTKPASEHFVLAALGLPDQTASEAFRRLSLTESAFVQALQEQRANALAAVGVSAPMSAHTFSPDLLPPKGKLYEAEASGQFLVQRLASSSSTRKERGFLSADVLLAVAHQSNSSASRAFQVLCISNTRLTEAATEAITSAVTAGLDSSHHP